MRKEAYDKLVKEALERIAKLDPKEVTLEVEKIKEALEVVLAEKDEAKLEQYYKNIDEFCSVNAGKGLEYLDGYYLLNGKLNDN